MQWNQLTEALRTARGHDDGADVYVVDPDGDFCPVSAVEVKGVQGRNLIVLSLDYDNYIEARPEDEPGDNAAASELPDNRNVGDPAIQDSNASNDAGDGSNLSGTEGNTPDSNDSIPGATV